VIPDNEPRSFPKKNGFPEEDLFKYLYVVASFGHDALVHSILKYALMARKDSVLRGLPPIAACMPDGFSK
jgi:hypothetical protein